MAKIELSVMAISKKPSVIEPGGVEEGVESRQLKMGIEGGVLHVLVSKNGRNCMISEFPPSTRLREYLLPRGGERGIPVLPVVDLFPSSATSKFGFLFLFYSFLCFRLTSFRRYLLS